MKDKLLAQKKNLRRQAEEMVNKRKSSHASQLSEVESIRLIHELEVHQIELELQNEELIQARMEAQAAARKYTDLYDFAPLGYFTLSTDGKILELNLQGAWILGKERGRLINSLLAFYITESQRALFNAFLGKIFQHEKKESCEISFLTNDNSPSYFLLSGIADESKNQCYITATDINERKMAEKALTEGLRLSAIGEMASSVAHDFNNSLQSILGNLELAIRNPDVSGNTLQELLVIKNIVRDVAERIMLLQRFGDKKKDQSNNAPINLNELIDEVIVQSRSLWKVEAERKGISVEILTEFHEIKNIYGNGGELRTVIFNLLKNSIEAMPAGGLIQLKTWSAGQGIYLSIKDTGEGMDAATQERIFQPFFSTKGFEAGRGLGMSGVLTIIHEHGGQVYVKETAPGKGTTIEIFFPASLAVPRKEEKFIPEHIRRTDKKLRILWVEDDASIGKVVVEFIRILGHEGDVASSAKKAIEFLDRHDYDLVITDIGMPDMNGWQLASYIRDKFGDQLKIAVVSGWNAQPNEEEKSRYGIQYWLSKPFSVSQLRVLLNEIAVGVGPK